VDQGIGALLNGLGDPGMVVPESRAHLTGVVVEVFLARDVADDRSTRPLEDRAGEYALVEAVAKGVLAGEGQQLIFAGRVRRAHGRPPTLRSCRVRASTAGDEARRRCGVRGPFISG
jgi:hypothetical protein